MASRTTRMIGLTFGAWQAAAHVTSQTLRGAIDTAQTVAEVVTAAQWSEG